MIIRGATLTPAWHELQGSNITEQVVPAWHELQGSNEIEQVTQAWHETQGSRVIKFWSNVLQCCHSTTAMITTWDCWIELLVRAKSNKAKINTRMILTIWIWDTNYRHDAISMKSIWSFCRVRYDFSTRFHFSCCTMDVPWVCTQISHVHNPASCHKQSN